jgi:acyl-CoA synthetase (AMP-forming)/AMP-acid ligase II
MNFTNFFEVVDYHATENPEALACTLVDKTLAVSAQVTYAELHALAKKLAKRLLQQGMKGQRALLVYPNSIEYLVAFLGCIYAGVIAVPVFIPRKSMHMGRLMSIIRDAAPSVALTNQKTYHHIHAFCEAYPELGSLSWSVTDELLAEPTEYDGWKPQDLIGDTIAFLQYTSGSTSDPKGVMLTHSNLLINQQMMQQAFQHDKHSIIAAWVPFYHDMGLILQALQALYVGCHCIIMSPMDFVQKPYVWLKVISDFRVTSTAAPNFAYDLCVEKVSLEEKKTLDLSCWTLALNAAEPVSAKTLRVFSAAFAECGFRATAFFPAYGLAEATVFITGKKDKLELPKVIIADRHALSRKQLVLQGAESSRTVPLVSCGVPFAPAVLKIVDVNTLKECKPGQVGEVWVKGPSISEGYWQKPRVSQETLKVCLCSDPDSVYLRTGDLALFHEGEIYICDRLKDMIIIHGQNYYPHDIEKTIEACHPTLVPSACALFSFETAEGALKVVLVAEISRHYTRDMDEQESTAFREITDAIRFIVNETYDIRLNDVVLIRQASIPKTTSGKIQRSACRQAYMSNMLKKVNVSDKLL